MSETTKLHLPLMAAAQAQKHITHNEALLKIDMLLHLEVRDKDLSTPPEEPEEGDRYIIAEGADGDWADNAGNIAAWQDGTWKIYQPQVGWRAFVRDEGLIYVKTEAHWVSINEGNALQNLSMLGIGTEANTENPFSAKINKALWAAKEVAEGGTGNLLYTLNKEETSNALSFLFQKNWSGRAEIGLIGDDDLAIKVSADGAVWQSALKVNNATGQVIFPNGIVPRAWVTLADNATINIDAATGNKFRLTTGGTRTIAKPTNLTDGQRFLLRITNNSAVTLTLNAAYEPLSGSAPTLRTASGQSNTFDCIYDSAADKIFYAWH